MGRATARVAREELEAGATEMAVNTRLRRTVSPEQARAVLALLEGRRVAARKLADTDSLFLDRAAAEQASPDAVARHTAARLADAAGGSAVADLGCGAGADTLALAEYAPVIAVDLDPGRLAMAAANADARGVASRVTTRCADLTAWAPPLEVGAAWLDPGRRDSTGRRLDPRAWSPPLATAIEVARRFGAAGIKLAPGIDRDLLPADAEVEFISLHGRLIEAVLWLGSVATPGTVRATALPAGASLAHAATEPDLPAEVRPVGAYLYDPDPGIGRAGLVRRLARALGAWQIAEEVAYLSSDAPTASPFTRRFRVVAERGFSERGARELLRAAGTGRIEVTRRGAPVDTNLIERRLNARLAGGDPVHTLVLTRVDGRITMVLCERERD